MPIPLLLLALAAPQDLFRTLDGPAIAPGGGFAGSVDAADLNGDGLPDLLQQTTEVLRVLINRGGGQFEPLEGALPPGLPKATGIRPAFGDLDGDGDADIVLGLRAVGLFGESEIRVLLNDGAGILTPGLTITSPAALGSAAPSPRLTDLDGDGLLDLVIAWTTLQILPGLGGGQFGPGLALTPTDFVSEVAVLDADEDGRPDLFVSGSPNSRLLLQDATGAFQPTPTNYMASFKAETADFDGDGRPELVFGEGNDVLRIYRSSSNGLVLAGSLNSGQTISLIARLHLVDFDEDGQRDVYASEDKNFTTADSVLWRGQGGLSFGGPETGVVQPEPIQGPGVLADLDGDGDIDVADPLRIFLQADDGSFELLSNGAAVPERGLKALGDLDGNGFQDLLIVDQGGGSFRTASWLSDGLGGLAELANSGESVPGSVTALDLGDLDGDGDVDAYVGRGLEDLTGRPQSILINDGNAVLREIEALSSGVIDLTEDVALLDADLDGDLDAFCANRFPNLALGANRLEENLGQGRFRDATDRLPAQPGDGTAVAVLDADSDGDPDLWVGQGPSDVHSGQDLLFDNDGTGRFTDVTVGSLPALERSTATLLLGDLDGDGRQDVMAVADHGENLPAFSEDRIYLADPAVPGRFLNGGPLISANVGRPTGAAPSDVDGDGDLDLVIDERLGSILGSRLVLYRNDGSANFALETSGVFGIGSTGGPIAMGDLDGDGDDELAGDQWLGIGMRRELEVRTAADLGQPLRFGLLSAEGAAGYALGYSGALVQLPLPGLGLLRLDLASSGKLIAVGSLDADGDTEVGLFVPDLPQLAGLELFWQAALLAPDALTRALSTRL